MTRVIVMGAAEEIKGTHKWIDTRMTPNLGAA